MLINIGLLENDWTRQQDYYYLPNCSSQFDERLLILIDFATKFVLLVKVLSTFPFVIIKKNYAVDNLFFLWFFFVVNPACFHCLSRPRAQLKKSDPHPRKSSEPTFEHWLIYQKHIRRELRKPRERQIGLNRKKNWARVGLWTKIKGRGL